MNDANTAALRTPERLDLRFGLVAGGYVATLISPVILLAVVERSGLNDELLTIGLLGAVGVAITSIVGWRVTRWGGLLAWFSDSRVAWFLPSVGLFPIFAYHFSFIVYLGFYFGGLELQTTAPLVRFSGFFLGIFTICLGSLLVNMGRNRLTDTIVDDVDVKIEWTASWTRADQLKATVGALLIGSVTTVVLGYLGWSMTGGPEIISLEIAATVTAPLFLTSLVYAYDVSSRSTYRLSRAGLERNSGQLFSPTVFVPWSQFDGVTVSDSKVVLHRGRFHPDVRFSRQDLSVRFSSQDHYNTDEEVIAALEVHLGS